MAKTIAERLGSLVTIQDEIRNAIKEKGVDWGDSTTFGLFPTMISTIYTSGGTSGGGSTEDVPEGTLITVTNSNKNVNIKLLIGSWNGADENSTGIFDVNKNFNNVSTLKLYSPDLYSSICVKSTVKAGYTPSGIIVNGVTYDTPVAYMDEDVYYSELFTSELNITALSPIPNKYTVTIAQSANQTIYVKYNNVEYTESFQAEMDEKWTARIVADEGYMAGALSKTSGTISGDITISAQPATEKSDDGDVYITTNNDLKTLNAPNFADYEIGLYRVDIHKDITAISGGGSYAMSIYTDGVAGPPTFVTAFSLSKGVQDLTFYIKRENGKTYYDTKQDFSSTPKTFGGFMLQGVVSAATGTVTITVTKIA